jgi:UDP-glucose 4-epimerase
MKYLVTGSSGHLGEALVRVLRERNADVVSIDLKPGAFTQFTGSIADYEFVAARMAGVDAVLHAATLHKPHVATHSRQDFVDTNITGTLNLLEAARHAGVSAFVFTSTTSTFGDALTPPPGGPAAWITEEVVPRSKNIYGATKLAAEDLCWLAHRRDRLPCIILRTSRFFPEEQDNAAMRGLQHRKRPGDRISASPRRHRGCGLRPSAGGRAGRGDRFRPLHHQRNHTIRRG